MILIDIELHDVSTANEKPQMSHKSYLLLSQLFRHTSLLTFPDDSKACFLFTIFSDAENSRSQGTVVARVVRYLRASGAMHQHVPSTTQEIKHHH